MKKLFLNMLVKVLSESGSSVIPQIFGEAVKERSLKLDPKKRYIIFLPEPGDQAVVEAIDDVVRGLSEETGARVGVIFTDNFRILEL